MAYSTAAMVRKALVPSSDGVQPETPSNTAADLSDGVLEDAIAEADSTIDSYLSSRYKVPVDLIPTGNPTGEDGSDLAVPHPIDFWSRSIAAYMVTLTFMGSEDLADTDPVVRRYKDTMAALQAVSGMKANLNLPENVTGEGSAVQAGPSLNPYIGDLWQLGDFSLGYDDGWSGQDPYSGWGGRW